MSIFNREETTMFRRLFASLPAIVFGVLIAVVNKITKGKAISKKEFGCANCPSRGACLENPENTGSAKEAK